MYLVLNFISTLKKTKHNDNKTKIIYRFAKKTIKKEDSNLLLKIMQKEKKHRYYNQRES